MYRFTCVWKLAYFPSFYSPWRLVLLALLSLLAKCSLGCANSKVSSRTPGVSSSSTLKAWLQPEHHSPPTAHSSWASPTYADTFGDRDCLLLGYQDRSQDKGSRQPFSALLSSYQVRIPHWSECTSQTWTIISDKLVRRCLLLSSLPVYLRITFLFTTKRDI